MPLLLWAVLGSGCETVASSEGASISVGEKDSRDQEYVIGPEDVLEVNVWKNPDLGKSVVVRPDGMITLPLIGEVEAGGRTAEDVREDVATRLQKYYKEVPAVTVTVSEVNSYYIYVLGEVRAPGKYQVKSYMTVLQAVALAGGFTEWADRNDLVVLREHAKGASERIRLRYKDIVKEGEPDRILRRGDTLIVP